MLRWPTSRRPQFHVYAQYNERWLTITNPLRSQFLLNPEVTYLNHGAFGACPRPVFEAYQRWQLELERQPVEFLGRCSDALLDSARAALAADIHTDADNLIFVPNATLGVNTVARSLALQPGDEILATNHEYGALEYTWQFMCGKTGARYVKHPISLPVTSAEAIVESFWQAVTPRTRVIFMSHITSPTALILPIAEICRRARAAGILTVIDGAHALGQIPVDVTALDVDFYSGNCHKWLCAPKGAGFLYARPEHQALIEPLVISWGYPDDSPHSGGPFVRQNQWQGTRDIAAFLSVPAAIEFQAAHHWDEVRQQCHSLAVETRQRIADLTGLAPVTPATDEWFMQMFIAPLPTPLPNGDMLELKRRLYDEYCIEVPLPVHAGQNYVRVSLQGYNDRTDADTLIAALRALL
jgi:isopenicillin-N epimerase